jgi:2-keto-4-pentenoate hydratase/2-oxohepta-3-ene-1,7-dioic acid hydratase in catechol pathway
VVGETVYDIAELTADARYASVLDVLEDWDNSHPAIEASIDSPRCAGHPISTVRLHAPVSRPGSIYCVGANYRDHAEEMRVAASRAVQPDPRSMGLKPFFFIKSSHSVADPGVSVSSTEYTQKLDWEVELVAVSRGTPSATTSPPATSAPVNRFRPNRCSEQTGYATRASTTPHRWDPG